MGRLTERKKTDIRDIYVLRFESSRARKSQTEAFGRILKVIVARDGLTEGDIISILKTDDGES